MLWLKSSKVIHRYSADRNLSILSAAISNRYWSDMARKPGTRSASEFVLFDVYYEDGSQRSNRKVPNSVLTGIEGDDGATRFLAEQDQVIARKSGLPAVAIKSVRRS